MTVFYTFTISTTNEDPGNSDINFNPNLTYGSVSDIDGNLYKTIQIGTQTWMAENLRTTKLRDNTPIELSENPFKWIQLYVPAFCWYNNSELSNSTYGALYDWDAINTDKLCPTGWHVPSDSEWSILISNLGGLNVVGEN